MRRSDHAARDLDTVIKGRHPTQRTDFSIADELENNNLARWHFNEEILEVPQLVQSIGPIAAFPEVWPKGPAKARRAAWTNWNSEDHRMNTSMLLRAAALALIALASGANGVRAETDQLRIAQQFGIAYLPLIVASEKGLIEQEAKALGIAPPKIEWLRLSGAAAMNEALISGGLDFATAGITPMILTWDKTRTTAKIIGVAALGSMANILTTNNPSIKTIADFTEKDRIALPSVKVGFQPIVLQMAADKAFGKYDKLDELTVSMPHPDATAQILSGRSEITAHFTSPPFSQQQLSTLR